MADTVYELGDVAVLSVTFTVAGTPTDPTTLTATVRKPAGTTTNYAYNPGAIIRDSVGVFHLNVAADQAGDWTYKFVGTGAAADVETGSFYVKPDPTATIGRDLCSIADVLSYVPGYRQNDATEAKLQQLIESESLLLQRDAGREIVAIAGANPRTFDLIPANIRRRSLPIGDAAAITKVELFDYDGTTSLGVIANALYVLEPRTRDEWRPYTRLRFPYRPSTSSLLLAPGRTLELTGTWGFPVVPAFVREACAKRVLLRYITDVATKGTALAEALDDVNAAALFASSRDALTAIRKAGFA
jgi:hypothetical protein